MDLNGKYFKRIDYLMLLIIICLAVFSYLGISSAKPESNAALKQLVWYAVGFSVMLFIIFVDYELIKRFSYVLYGLGIVLLLGLFVFAEPIRGVVSWYSFFNGRVAFQPAELAKIFTILALARYLDDRRGREFTHFRELLIPFAILGVPLLIILLQPDLGTALVFIVFLVVMLLVYGVSVKHFAIMGGITGVFVGVLVFLYNIKPEYFYKIIQPHQFERLVSFIDPSRDPLNTGYHVIQSLIAVGSGRLTGVGLGEGKQGRFNWVPDAHTDFIFSVIAEELGFIGASILILLLFVLLYRIYRIGTTAPDTYGMLVTAGIVGMLIFTIFENIGMTVSIMPITGIPLPFISYGGSSILTNFISLGLILNIGVRRSTKLFD
jgi:rod shape determining protein RodA